MKWHLKVVFVLMVAMVAVSTVACEKQGEAEKAGKTIDKAFNTAKDKIHDATE